MDGEKQMSEKMNEQQEGGGASSEPMNEEKSTGAIIGAIIIVVLLIIGGIYFLGQRVNEEPATPAPEEILTQPDILTETLSVQGTSDEIVAIEADLGTEADFGNLDAELGNIDAELNF